jgi:D-alanyl-D-alanine carboxypeptidase
MVSSNDSAEALAQSYGRKEFIKEMNNFVNKIGAYKTYFVDPSGLSPKNAFYMHRS